MRQRLSPQSIPLLFSGCHLTRAEAAALHCGGREEGRQGGGGGRRGEKRGGGGGGNGGSILRKGWVMWEERRRPQCDSEGLLPPRSAAGRGFTAKRRKKKRTKAADTLKGFETRKKRMFRENSTQEVSISALCWTFLKKKPSVDVNTPTTHIHVNPANRGLSCYTCQVGTRVSGHFKNIKNLKRKF